MDNFEYISKYQKLEGFLSKKSPQILKGYQKRYFIMYDNGSKLCYYKTKPKATDEPQGMVHVEDIENITSLASRDFYFEYSGRKFQLRAQTEEEKEIWIEGLKALVAYFQQASPGIKQRRGAAKSWKLSNLQTADLERIKLENEMKNASENSSPDFKKLSNEEVLQAIGLSEYFEKIDPKLLESRLCMGWLSKEHKKHKGFYQPRWFILMSAKPLKKDCDQDSEILHETNLPHWLELETMYYFDQKEITKKSACSGIVPLIDCVEVSFKEKEGKKLLNKGLKFKVELDDRVFTLRTPLITERNKWIDAINMSRATAHQQKKSKSGLGKNIDPLVSLCDKEGAEKLRSKINEEYANIFNAYPVTSYNDLEEVLALLDALSKDLIAAIDACYAYEPPRDDIVKVYMPIYHDKICEILTKYYKINVESIDNLELIHFINWMSKYTQSLAKYEFKEERLENGVKVLIKVFAKRMLKTNMEIVLNILIQLRDSKTITDSEGLNVTNGAYDLFKILNDTFAVYNKCSHPEVAESLLNVVKEVIEYYQSLLETMIEKLTFPYDKYVAFSNDVIRYKRSLDEFVRTVENMTGMESDKIEELLPSDDLVRGFAKIGEKSFERVSNYALKSMNLHFKPHLMKLDMSEVLTKLFDEYSVFTTIFHKKYSRKMWKLCLERLVLLYIQTLISHGKNIKYKKIEQLLEKLNKDKEAISEGFKGSADASHIKEQIKVVDDLQQFLEASPALVPIVTLTLKEIHGTGFNLKVVKVLLNLKVDMSWNEKRVAVNECKKVLKKFEGNPENNLEGKMGKNIFDKLEIEIDEKNDIEQQQQPQNGQEPEKETKPKESPKEKKSKNKEEKDLISLELGLIGGYLYKKKFSGYKKKYYMIKEEKLYWSKNDANICETSKIKEIKTLKKCYPIKERGFILTWGQKVLKLKAVSTEERDKWVQVVKNIFKDIGEKDKKAEAAAQLVILNSLFEDCEPVWTLNQRDVAILLRLEKQVIAEKKPSPTKTTQEEGSEKRRDSINDLDQSTVEQDVSRTSEKKKSAIKRLFKMF